MTKIKNNSSQPGRTAQTDNKKLADDGFGRPDGISNETINLGQNPTVGQINPRAYSQNDLESVESLRGFNESIGGGLAQVELTEGERAYALEKGYIKNSQRNLTGVRNTVRRGPR